MSKKAKHGHASSTWEWQDDDGWKPYDASVQAEISQAIARGEDFIMEGKYMLSFDAATRTGTQINGKTGWRRRMRSVPSGAAAGGGSATKSGGAATKTGGSSTWQWQDDDRSWKSFDDATQARCRNTLNQTAGTPTCVCSRAQKASTKLRTGIATCHT